MYGTKHHRYADVNHTDLHRKKNAIKIKRQRMTYSGDLFKLLFPLDVTAKKKNKKKKKQTSSFHVIFWVEL